LRHIESVYWIYKYLVLEEAAMIDFHFDAVANVVLFFLAALVKVVLPLLLSLLKVDTHIAVSLLPW